jgi:hypothetical protein
VKKAERIHLNKVAAIGCIVCKLQGHEDTPAEIHHLRDGQGRGQRAEYTETIPLCPTHHRTGDGTAAFGYQWGFHHSPKEFEEAYGTERELLARVRMELA